VQEAPGSNPGTPTTKGLLRAAEDLFILAIRDGLLKMCRIACEDLTDATSPKQLSAQKFNGVFVFLVYLAQRVRQLQFATLILTSGEFSPIELNLFPTL